ncbi:hypothetical protein LLS1_24550 [Leifsonia sp. LS1]|nr:hypothetical protein LLS1_24550 [Leifsonia sp. LS1]
MLSVLFVCTGNICRSPYAQAIAVARATAAGAALTFASAGTQARDRMPMDPRTVALLARADVPVPAHQARLLREEFVSMADLIVTMTGEQRSAVVRAWPDALRRTFTIAELPELADASGATPDGSAPIDVYLDALRAARPRLRDSVTARVDVADPYGGPAAGYAAMAEHLGPLVERLVDLLANRTTRPDAGGVSPRRP